MTEAISTPPSPTLTVAAVARRLGVAPPTLRTWDRRYGLGPSAHTAGAHRRYSPADVARLMVMRRLTLEGVAPSDAAKIALATALTPEGRPVQPDNEFTPAEGFDASTLAPGLGGVTENPARRQPRDYPQGEDRYPPGSFLDETTPDGGLDEVELSADYSLPDSSAWSARGRAPRTVEEHPDDELDLTGLGVDGFEAEAGDPQRTEQLADDWPGMLRSVETSRSSTSGGGRVVALPDGTAASRGLARAAMSLDSFETHRLLNESIRRQGVVPTWDTMIMPVLRALGERVRVSGEGIDVEHAFSEVILGVLRNVAVNVRITRNSPMVLLACADSDYHSMPLHALAAALAEHEVPTRMLGTGLPPHALASSVRRTGPSVIVLFARMPGADAADSQVLRRQRPAPTVILAGPGWRPDTIPASARTAGSLIEAIDEVLRGLHN
ncbi:MerR family transcriptional regulator [Kineosporia succinea]|uniref:Transposase-like protein n=1 Tax=Kineosporia succinea TaxID=84632 RepID=A0ABT9P3V0_9ACTN|nr:MerR family transcriptional regulator [Kineosporia succinea]MDP9827236.1 transposase-like protein [Kineosporia succinea]